ncbi:MAG TPA: OpcA/G6PD domain-containing protein [Candidatus Dormibacteraeota bacterium]|nr:OpcA/G6PD domain-containing protein [Candidatus Dormibacteraeota bacterium]
MSVNARIATMTLLVFVEDPQLVPWVRERAQRLARRHASRVVLLNAGLAQSHPQQTDGAEWTEVGVQGASAENIHVLASRLLPPAVPRILLWAAPQTASDERFVRLAPEMRTTLLDSSRARDDDAALRDLVAFCGENCGAESIHDLAYLRLAPWQEVVADFFDERAFVEDLFDLRRVTIASGSDAEGYYLLGWLASRLSWTPDGNRTFRQKRRARGIAYAIVREGQPRRVKRITLESGTTRFQAQLCDTDAVSLEVSGTKQRPPRVAPLHGVDVASLIERAILHEQRDPVFRESLDVAGHLLAADGG